VNNLRGQIFREIRRGIPPATKPFPRDWGSARLWPVITRCWDVDPVSRLSAFVLGHLLKRTVFTLPSSVIQRVIQLLDSSLYNGERWIHFSESKFKERTSWLANLSLVSRTCRAWATPALYRLVGLYSMGRANSLISLVSTLQSSSTSVATLNMVSNGYGTYTDILVIIFNWEFSSPLLLHSIKSLVYIMPRLRLVVIGSGPTGHWSARVDSITTLEIRGLSISFILDNHQIIKTLSCFQRLCLVFCTRKTSPYFGPSKLCFPDLQEVDIDFIETTALSQFLEELSSWTMQSFRSFCYYIRETPPLLRFLSVRGPPILHLTLKFLENNEGILVSQVLPLCPNLISVVVMAAPLDTLEFPLYHPTLEYFRIELIYPIDDARQAERERHINNFNETAALSSFPRLKQLAIS